MFYIYMQINITANIVIKPQKSKENHKVLIKLPFFKTCNFV